MKDRLPQERFLERQPSGLAGDLPCVPQEETVRILSLPRPREWPAPSLVDPDRPDIARELIELPRIDPALIGLCKHLAARISDTYDVELEPRSKLDPALRGIRKGAAFTSIEAYTTSLRTILLSEFAAEGAKFDFEEVLALSAYFVTKTTSPATGYMTKLPTGLFSSSASDPLTDSTFVKRAGIALRHYFTEEGSGEDPLRTARDIEERFNLKKLYHESGLSKLANQLEPLQVLDLAFPGIRDGEDPAVREWYIRYNGKWQDSEKVGRALAWVLEFGERVVTRVEGAPVYDLPAMRERDWGTIFNDERYGLHGMMSSNGAANNSQVALELAATALGGQELFGAKAGQLGLDDVRVRSVWGTKDGTERIADTLARCDRTFRVELPRLFDLNGQVVAQELQKVDRWGDHFDGVSKNFLQRAKLTTPQALRIMYPHAFGWAPNQIKPWESPHQVAWGRIKPETMVVPAVAYTLGRLGLGVLHIRGSELQLDVTAAQFESWTAAWAAERGSLRDTLQGMGLSGVFKSGVPSGDLRGAACMLFGHADSVSALREISRHVSNVTFNSVMRHLFAQSGGVCKVVIADLAKSEREPVAKHFNRATGDFEALLHIGAEIPPTIGDRISFLTEFDAKLLREVRGVRPRKLKSEDSPFDPKGTPFAEALRRGDHAGTSVLRRFINADLSDRSVPIPRLGGYYRLLRQTQMAGRGAAPMKLSARDQLAVLSVVSDFVVDSSNLVDPFKPHLKSTLQQILSQGQGSLVLLNSAFRTARHNVITGDASRFSQVQLISDLINLAMAGAQEYFRAAPGR